MFFRNLTLFRFSPSVAASLSGLADQLEEKRLRACGPLELSTRGFVSPLGRDHDVLTHTVGDYVLFTLGGEDKLLPGSVVNEALAQRLKVISETEGRRIGGRERKRLKDEVLTDLLPRAFVRPCKVNAYLDLADGWLVVDTRSRTVAEDVVTSIREAIGTFPAIPMAPEESPRVILTHWVSRSEDGAPALPEGFALGDEAELRDPAESGAIVRCRRQDLETDEVREHLKTGKQVFALSVDFEDRLSFVVSESMQVRSLHFLDQVLDELDRVEPEGAQAELDARMALMTLELSRLLRRLESIFGLPRPTDR